MLMGMLAVSPGIEAQDELEAKPNVELSAPTDIPPQSAAVTASEFQFSPQVLAVSTGPTQFAVNNVGVVEHNFVIENARGQVIASVTSIPAGQSATLDVDLSGGTFTFVCTLPAHREAGMAGVLTVTS